MPFITSALRCVILLVSLGLAASAALARPLDVIFINPGRSDETYWRMVTDFMQAAAEDLDIRLDVRWAERNHLRQIAIGEEIASARTRPDFVILVNEKLVAPETLRRLDGAGIKTFLILNDLTEAQKATDGKPRGRYKNWIGTLAPDNVDAGYKIARALFADAGRKGIASGQLVAISGSRGTPATTDRRAGLARALAETGRFSLAQEVWGEFEEGRAYEQTKSLLNRHPEVRLIWAANDAMALGALRAAQEAGKTPGKDIVVAGLNWSPDALRAIRAGTLAATVGGHFMIGGWSLVVLRDYANGRDFAQVNGVELKPDVFGVIDVSNVEAFMVKFSGQDWRKLDFTKFSSRQKKDGRYDFSLSSVIR